MSHQKAGAGMDLSKQIGTVRDFLHVRVRESYHAIQKILVNPAIDDPKEKVSMIAKHLIRCLPASEEEKMIAATIGSLNAGDRYEAFNDYADETSNRHILLTRGIGAATAFALDNPKGYRFDYVDGKCVVNYGTDRPRNFERRNASDDEEDGRHNRYDRREYSRGRGSRGRGRGRGRGGRDTRDGRSRSNVVSSEDPVSAESPNQFDALRDYSKSASSEAKKPSVAKDEAKQNKENLVKDGDAVTKAMMDGKGKNWAEVPEDEDSSPDNAKNNKKE